MKILIGTQNPGKFLEFSQLLSQPGIAIVSPVQAGISDFDVEETGLGFAENALIKAKAFAEATGLTSVADDSGLEITALDNMPGVHSKRFLGNVAAAERHLFLIDQLKQQVDRSARFTSCLCLYDPQTKQHQVFQGAMTGSIAFQPAGSEGFDYDLIFVPQGEHQTLAELGLEYKNKMSARSQAMDQLKKYLNTLI